MNVNREELWTEEESVTLSQVASLLETAGPYQNYCRSHGKEAGQKLLDQFVSRFESFIALYWFN